jgi:hypothetical protein
LTTASFFIGGIDEDVVEFEGEAASLVGVSPAGAADAEATSLAIAAGSVTGVSSAVKSTAVGGSDGVTVPGCDRSLLAELDPALCAKQAICTPVPQIAALRMMAVLMLLFIVLWSP